MNGGGCKVERVFQGKRKTACAEAKREGQWSWSRESREGMLEVRLDCWQRLGHCALSVKLKV